MSSGDYGFPDFGNTYTSPTISSFPESLGNLQPIQPNLQGVYHGVASQQHQPGGYGVPPPGGPRLGAGAEKRKSESSLSPEGPVTAEEQGRRAAEEDKRRRNTAASARFRVKKKQREQALEKSAKEMTEKVTALEGRIQQLETENKWLKNIVVEKNGGNAELVTKLIEEFNSKSQARLRKEAEEVSNLKAPTSPEEREAADSSG